MTTITDSSMAEYQTHDQKGCGSNLPLAKLFLFKTPIVISYMGVFISTKNKMTAMDEIAVTVIYAALGHSLTSTGPPYFLDIQPYI